jgi:hypothetical protein
MHLDLIPENVLSQGRGTEKDVIIAVAVPVTVPKILPLIEA